MKLKLKDHINNFEQIHGDFTSTTWELFVNYLQNVSDYKITSDSLVGIFYQALDDNCKAVTDTIIGGSFLDCTCVDMA